ncbi:MAG: alpha-D-ribose 1-methylphosphonate 5-triphosphate diphosphatase [Candidatus Rokuibacteriota bacterium]
MSELVLANARVVLRDEVVRGAVRLVAGRIESVVATRAVLAGETDLEGDYLIPGIVELHTDVLEKHAFPRPGARWPELAAVVAHDGQLIAAGITTVLDSLAFGYVIDGGQRARDPGALVAAIRAARAGGLLKAEHLLHLRCEVSTEHVVHDFAPHAEDPLVRLVSIMDHAPGQRQFTNVATYREYNKGKYGLSDAELDTLVARRVADRLKYGDAHRAAILGLCQAARLPLASHDDATTAHVEEAAKAGMVIAEFPTTREAALAAKAYGLAIIAGAPNLVMGRSHSGNVSAAELAAERLLDVLSSDYVPASALHGAFLLHGRRGWSLPDAIACVTATPAERVGLDDRGEIAPGRNADLVRVRLAGELPLVIAVWRDGARVA